MQKKDMLLFIGLTVILTIAVSMSTVSLTGYGVFDRYFTKITVQKAPSVTVNPNVINQISELCKNGIKDKGEECIDGGRVCDNECAVEIGRYNALDMLYKANRIYTSPNADTEFSCDEMCGKEATTNMKCAIAMYNQGVSDKGVPMNYFVRCSEKLRAGPTAKAMLSCLCVYLK